MVMGLLSLVFGGLAAWFLVRERSADAAPASALPGPAVATTGPSAPPVSMRAFLSDRIWWTLALWNMLFGFSIRAGIMVHFAAMMQDRGMSLAQAATAMSLIGAGGFVGNLMAGWLIDHTSATRLARVFVLAPLGCHGDALLFGGSVEGEVIAAAVLLGVFNSGDHSLSVFLTQRCVPTARPRQRDAAGCRFVRQRHRTVAHGPGA